MLQYQYLKVYTNTCVHINITLTFALTLMLTCTFTNITIAIIDMVALSQQSLGIKHIISTLVKHSQRCKAERGG